MKIDASWLKIGIAGKFYFAGIASLSFALLMTVFSTILTRIIRKDLNPIILFSTNLLGMFIGGILGGMMFAFS